MNTGTAAAYIAGYDDATKLVEAKLRKVETHADADSAAAVAIRKTLEATLADLKAARPA